MTSDIVLILAGYIIHYDFLMSVGFFKKSHLNRFRFIMRLIIMAPSFHLFRRVVSLREVVDHSSPRILLLFSPEQIMFFLFFFSLCLLILILILPTIYTRLLTRLCDALLCHSGFQYVPVSVKFP